MREEHVEVDVAVAAAVVVGRMVAGGVQAVFDLDREIGCEVDFGSTKRKEGDFDRMDGILLLRHDHHKRMALQGPRQALYSHPSRRHLEFAPALVAVEAE